MKWPRGERDKRERERKCERVRVREREREGEMGQRRESGLYSICPLDESDMSYLLAALPGNLH